MNFLTNIYDLYIVILVYLLFMTYSRRGRANSYGNFDRRYARGPGRTLRQIGGFFVQKASYLLKKLLYVT